MLKIEFGKREVGKDYLIINGEKDSKSRVTYVQSTGQAIAEVRKHSTITILSDSTFNEVGEQLLSYEFFHSYKKEWDATLRLRVICSGNEHGWIEVIFAINSTNWEKSFSINSLRSFIENMIGSKSGSITTIREVDNKPSALVKLCVRLYKCESNTKIGETLQNVVGRFESLLEEAKNKLSRNANGFEFRVPKEIVLALKQYIVFFPEYVEVAKGKKIFFEVKTTQDGIYIETGADENFEDLNRYFNEYLGFVKSNIEELSPLFEIELSETKKELFVLNLKQQVVHLKQQIELKNFEIKVLEREVERYYNILITQSNKQLPPITVNAFAKAESNVDIKIDIKQELFQLQSDILALKSVLSEEVPEPLKKEIDIIDNELMNAEPNELEKAKKPLSRIKRIFNLLTDEESTFSKTVQKSKKLKEGLQKLGKTYNKIAQWLAMPTIPDVLLEI